MPKIEQTQEIDITPEKFLRNCSRDELIELDTLIQSNHYQHQMYGEPATEVSLIELPTHKRQLIK